MCVVCVSNAENSLRDIFVSDSRFFPFFARISKTNFSHFLITAVVCLCVINNNTKRIIIIIIILILILILMVKKREEDDNDDKKANLALKTRDTVSLEMKNNEDDIDENDDDDFMYSEMEKKALETEEEEEWKTSSYKIENMQLKLYVDVLDKLCKEDKIEQFVKVFAPPDLEEEDRVYFMESLKGTMENGERWKRMKREIEILQTGKYRGISGDQERGPVEFRFDMMVDEDKEEEDNNNNSKKKKKNRNSIHIMREVVFRKTNNVWHAEG